MTDSTSPAALSANPFVDWIMRDPETIPSVHVPDIHGVVLDQLVQITLHRLQQRNNQQQATLVYSSFPGSGKTHLLHQFISRIRDTSCPVFIPPMPHAACLEKAILDRLVIRLWHYFPEVGHRNRFEWLALELLGIADPEQQSAWRNALHNLDSCSTQQHLQDYESDLLETFSNLFTQHQVPESRSWAWALVDALTTDHAREERALAWMRGEWEPYLAGRPSTSDTALDPAQVDQRAPLRLTGLLQLYALTRPVVLILDQLENLLVHPGAMARTLQALQHILQQSPATQAVLAANVFNWESLIQNVPQSFNDRIDPRLALEGLAFSQAVALRNARAQAAGPGAMEEAQSRIPESAIRRFLQMDASGNPTALITPRAFLRWCAQRWDSRASFQTDLSAEWQKVLQQVDKEGLGFFQDAIETVLIEVLSGTQVQHKGYPAFQIGNHVVVVEDSTHWKRWEARCLRLIEIGLSPSAILLVRPGKDLTEHLRQHWYPVPGPKWRQEHALRRLLATGARLLELDCASMRQIQATARMLDLASDLETDRATLAEWLRSSGKMDPFIPPLPHPAPAAENSRSSVSPPVPASHPSPAVAVVTVSELVRQMARPDGQIALESHLPPRERGMIFHELASRLIQRLRSTESKATAAATLEALLQDDSLSLNVAPHDHQTPRIQDALRAMAHRLDQHHQEQNHQPWHEILLETEKTLVGAVGSFDGVTLVLSGRCDLLRRRSDGMLEVVDYKLSGDSSRYLAQQLQLALYARLCANLSPPILCGGCLEIYSPDLQEQFFSFEELNQQFEEDIIPAVRRLVAEERQRRPDLARLELHLNNLEHSSDGGTAPAPPPAPEFPPPPTRTGRDTLPAPSPDAAPAMARAQAAFTGFIGNEQVVQRLQTALADAILAGDPPVLATGFLLTGPGGLGKTELALRVARALGHPLVHVQGSRIRRLDDLRDLVEGALADHHLAPQEDGTDSGLPRWIYPPLVLFIDEVHELGRLADKLLGLFEPRERRAVAEDAVMLMPCATFLAATTDKFRLPRPFQTRFQELALQFYTEQEVAEILRSRQVPGDNAFRSALARAGRLNPRVTLTLAEEFARYHRVHGLPYNAHGLARMRQQWKITEDGLTERDLVLLNLLAQGPQSLRTLAQRLGVTENVVAEEIEPYLLQQGLITITHKGRQLTPQGRQRLAQTRS